ncbi:transketolase C-terminal domain-containing protein [Actinoallomurus sp. NPDC050550]|uniref:alpha-ketoacid dehydrogenase subunit beta n=1 Tax=Actinoallomurus sp. NPDC050550 TaxID=3154937 RepID=UPI0034030177
MCAERTTERLTLREAILEGIAEEMAASRDVVVVGQDVGDFGGPLRSTEGLWRKFGPDQVIQTPICESAMVSMGVGMALTGCRPIVEIMFTDLLPVAATPLIQLAPGYRYLSNGKGTVPLVIRTRGGDGPYRAHPQNYEAIFAHSPGLTVVMPSTPADGKGLIKSAIRSGDPVLFIENIFLYNSPRATVPADDDHVVPLRSAKIVHPGTDVSLVTYGRCVRTCTTAASRLAEHGIAAEVIDLRTVSPFDEATVLDSVRRTRHLVVVHEAWVSGGLGAEIVARVTEDAMTALRRPPVRLGAPPVPLPWAEPLRDAVLPTPQLVVDSVRDLLSGSPS